MAILNPGPKDPIGKSFQVFKGYEILISRITDRLTTRRL